MKRFLFLILLASFGQMVYGQTVLNRGDLAVVGINAALKINGSPTNKDEVSFVCFKDITAGTEIQITDNGYGTCKAGQWSSIEGGAKLKRTGTTIPAGTIITFRNQDTAGGLPAIYFTAPDNNWQVSDLSPIVSAAGFNLNSAGDQIYFAQGGVWTPLATNCTASGRTAPNADFPGVSGRMLFGFSTSGRWVADATSQESDLYPGLSCFSMAPTKASNYIKYIGSLTAKSQVQWIAAISNVSNWGDYTIDNYSTKAPLWGTTVKTISITSNDIPNPDWAAPTQPVCKNASPINLNTLITPAGTTGGTWSGTGVSGSTFNPATSGPGKFYITYSVNYITGGSSCPVSKVDSIIVADDATIKYSQPTFCKKTGTAAVTRTGLAGGTYSAGAGLSINATTGAIDLAASTPGTYTVSYAYGSAPCNGTATTSVTISDVATPVVAETQAPTCLLTGTVTVNSPSTGVTYSIDGTNFQTSNLFLGLAPQQTYTITVKNSDGCTASTTIKISAVPTAPNPPVLTPVQPDCSNPAGSITVDIQAGVTTYGISSNGGSTFTNQSTNVFTGLVPGKYTIRVTNAAGCFNETSITINAAPGAPAAPTVTTPVTYCQNAAPATLSATGTSLLWYTTASGGTGSTTAPTPTTTAAGNTDYFVSQTVSGCESPRAKITVTITAAPTAPDVTTPVTYCQNGSPTALTATGSNLLWYNAASGGTGSATAPTPVTTAAGTTNFFVSQTVSGCESPRALIAVTVNATPAAPTVTTPVLYCNGSSPTALTATGTNLLWYNAASGGTGSAIAPTPSASTNGNTDYFVSQTISGCESPRATITLTINPVPAAPVVTSPLSYCQNSPSTTLSATGIALLWYSNATGGTGSGTAPTPSTNTVGANNYYVTQTVSGCESPRASIVVNTLALPTATIAYTGSPYLNSGTANVTQTGTIGGNYTVSPSSGLVIDAVTGQLNLGASLPGTYTVTYSFSAGTCSNKATAIVVVNPTNTEVFIPNTFTPNGDNKNDVFLVYGNTITTIDLKIFNQWGEMVFETKDKSIGWDGTVKGQKQPTGVYIYAAKINLQNGTSISKKGSINLIR